MNVARRHNGLVQTVTQLEHRFVEFLNFVNAVDDSLAQHVLVVSERLHFQIIVVVGNFTEFIKTPSIHNRAVQLPCFTRRADDEALPVLVQKAPGHARYFEEILHVRFGNDLIQVFQSGVVAHQNNEMEILFGELTRAAKAGVDVLEALHAAHGEIFQHLHENLRECQGIIARAMMIERRNLEILADGIQLIVAQTVVKRLSERERIEIGAVEIEVIPLGRLPDETDIKAMSVVCDKRSAVHEFQEFAHRLFLSRRIRDHFVRDAGQLRDLLGNVHSRIGKRVVLFADLAVFHNDRADLGDAVFRRRKARGFNIKYDKRLRQLALSVLIHDRKHVVNKVRLAPVDEFEVRVLPVDIIRGKHRFRVSLHNAVVGNGHRAVSHAMRHAHGGAGVAEAVHAGELRMHMKLHALFFCRVLTRFPDYFQHVVRAQNKFARILVIHILTAHDQRIAVFQAVPFVAFFALVEHDFQIDGTGVVRDGNRIDIDLAAVFDFFGKHIAPDGDLTGRLLQIPQREHFRRSKRFAGDQLGGFVRQAESLDFQDRAVRFRLELLGRCFARHGRLQFFHGNDGVAGQRDLRTDARALCDGIGHAVTEPDLCQQGRSVFYTDGNILPVNLNNRSVEKSIDRKPFFFQFFRNLQKCLRREILVGKTAAEADRIPHKERLL